MQKLTLFLLSLCFFQAAEAQVKLTEKVQAPMLAINGGLQLPAGDLKERFGANFTVGADLLFKTKKNILLGAYGHFMFGSVVKEDSILRAIQTSKGHIINNTGQLAEVSLFERGFSIGLRAGKIIPLRASSPNSGLMLTIGAGYLQHKIRIQNLMDDVPELQKEYKKGYDRLSSGLAISEFIGYMNLDKRRRLNYYFGIELNQAFTKSRRSYNFDTMSRDLRSRFDLLNGFRFGIIVPFYSKVPDDYYYN